MGTNKVYGGHGAIERQTCRDSTVGPPKPMGTRGATMADTVGHPAD